MGRAAGRLAARRVAGRATALRRRDMARGREVEEGEEGREVGVDGESKGGRAGRGLKPGLKSAWREGTRVMAASERRRAAAPPTCDVAGSSSAERSHATSSCCQPRSASMAATLASAGSSVELVPCWVVVRPFCSSRHRVLLPCTSVSSSDLHRTTGTSI